MCFVQEDKRSLTSANGFKSSLLYALAAYKLFFETCKKRFTSQGLPAPKEINDVLYEIRILMSDNANNEQLREKIIQGWVGRELTRIKCLHHTLMLACKDVRKSCNKVTVAAVGKERDKRIGEFGGNNLVDSVQIQLAKEFAHLNPYAFGHGAVDFPTWMSTHHPGEYIGMDRIVGNRSMVFLRNALVHNAMMPYYLQWLDWIITDVDEYNRLHIRTQTKLGCAEVCASIKARALMFVHLLHPLLVLSQSTKLGSDRTKKRKAYFLDQGPFIRQALAVVTELSQDPTPLLVSSFDMLDCVELETELGRGVRREHLRWCTHDRNRAMIEVLCNSFKDSEILDMVMPLLRSHMVVLIARFQWGTLAEFHEGGKFYDADLALQREPALAKAPLQTDSIERNFGVYSDKKSKLNGNTGLHSTAGCSTYVANDTSNFMHTNLTDAQRDVAITLLRRKGRSMAREGPLGTEMKTRVSEIRLHKKEVAAVANKTSLENKVFKHLKLRSAALVLPTELNVKAFNERVKDLSPAGTTRYIKQCQTILKLCFQVKGGDLIAYSAGGHKFDHKTIKRAYIILLRRIESKKLQIRDVPLDIVDCLMADQPAYRKGTQSKEFLQLQRDRYMLIHG